MTTTVLSGKISRVLFQVHLAQHLSLHIYIYIYIYIYILKRHYKEIEWIILHKRMMVKKEIIYI